MRDPFPPALWLTSGTFDTRDPSPTRDHGGYSADFVDLAGSAPDADAVRALQRDVINEYVGGRRVGENISFFARKIAWTWGDGNFWGSGGTPRRSVTSSAGSPLGGVVLDDRLG